MITIIISLFLLSLIVTSLISLWKDSSQVDILIEFKSPSNPFFNIGLSYNQFVETEYIEQELIIGLFFINFVVVAFKEIEA
jgi:hypothetical protein